MIAKIKEFILPSIIDLMVHKREKLNQKEQDAKKQFMAGLTIVKRKTKEPLIVAMIGLVGSGKTTIAKELAEQIGANVIEADAIRVAIRQTGASYEKARKIAEDVALEIIKQDGNVILDSDFIDANKRASIREKARKVGVRLVFIRTYCDFDVAIGRILSAEYENKPEDFFGGASSGWQGENKGAVVKIRELWRRTPHHYKWTKNGGGEWLLKKLPFDILMEIDMTNETKWKERIRKFIQKI